MKFRILAVAFLGQFALSLSPSFAADQIPTAKGVSLSSVSPQGDLTRQDIKAQMKVSREDRYQKMPYLDRRLVQEMITLRQVKEKEMFIRLKNQKSLEEVIERSVRSHTPARAAWEKIALARRKILAAVRNLFPEASYELNHSGGFLSQDAFNSGNFHFKFRQPVFHGGILWNTLLQGKAELESGENEYDAVIGELIRDVSKAYFDYNRAKEQVRDHRDALNQLKKFQEMSLEKNKAKIISEIEHLNAQSLYGQLEYEYETSKQELELAKLELQKLMNLEMQDDIDIQSLYSMQTLFSNQNIQVSGTQSEKGMFNFSETAPVMKVDELVDLAYQNRPELRVEASKLEAARLAEKIKWGKLMPQADVTVEFGRLAESLDVISLAPGWRNEFRCMLELNWNAGGNKVGYTLDHNEKAPNLTQIAQSEGSFTRASKVSAGLLDGLSDYVDTKQAEVQKIEQIVELEKAEKKIIQDVKQAYFDYHKNEIQVKSVLQKASYHKRLVELSKHRLDQNEVPISDYLQAEINLLEELSKLHKAIADYLSARAAMNYAIGVPQYLKFGEKNGTYGSTSKK
ncbi:MAG: TolC family protein [Candidatus Omnitrophica bacterium]|nr:TolC family protein [Candidatus Omnitrophota bacterium]